MSGLKDRGLIKWNAASFLPEHSKMIREFKREYYKQSKPCLDENQIEEFENLIALAKEYNFLVKIKLYNEGFPEEVSGYITDIFQLNKKLRIKREDLSYEEIHFADIIGLTKD